MSASRSTGRRVGLWLLVGLFAVSAATINPLQHGLSALVDHPAAQLGRNLRSRPDTGVVLNVFANPGGDISAQGGLTASGVPMLTGVNGYPDVKAWRVLDPDDSSRHAWNRFNVSVWTAGQEGSKPKIQLHPPAAITVTIDPCDPRLARLGVATVVSDAALPHSCLVEVARSHPGPPLVAYRIDRSRP